MPYADPERYRAYQKQYKKDRRIREPSWGKMPEEQRKVARRKHILSDLNFENKTALCAHCGTVSIVKNGKYYVCQIANLSAGRKSLLKSKYGLTPEDVDSMLIEQKYQCGVCGKDLRTNRLCVDHDHFTGQVRGLLCSNCNSGIGLLGDTLEGLIKAVNYLCKVGYGE